MRFEVSVPVAARADEAWAWWTDYGEPGQAFRVSHGGVWSVRRVLESANGRVVVKDGPGPFGVKREIHVHPEGRFLKERALDRRWDWESTWRFESLGESSARISREVEVRGAWGKLASVAPKIIERAVRQDLEGHVADLERDLRGPRGA